MKFLKSVYFNIIVAVLSAVLIMMQEVWIGTSFAFLNIFTLGALTGILLSLCAETIKMLFFNNDGKFKFSLKNVLIGGGISIIAALITGLLIV